ncbi:MAG: DUF3159 domain-containing protein [Microbacterium sp.]
MTDERDPLTPPEPSASELLGQALGGAARRMGVTTSEGETAGAVVWRSMGGWRGILESVLPSLVFLIVYTVHPDPLWISLAASVGLAAVFTLVRVAQKSPPAAALGGLCAAAVAAALALITGKGEETFLPGFITNTVYGSVLLISALVGWSLIGVAAGFLTGEGTAWRSDKRRRRVYFWLTLAWAALFIARLAVQLPLYFAGNVTALGTVKLAMGLPLFAPLVAVTFLAIRAMGAAPSPEGEGDTA